MNIKVTVRSAYGQDRVYPACDQSRVLARLADTKTFTKQHLVYIVALGYSIDVYTPMGEWLHNLKLNTNRELH